jgi:23S rRNA (cytidine1920-2'-O)/16S rRNA (cytidine1409-2'-O)-methyltransferase
LTARRSEGSSERLDRILVQRGLAENRSRAQALVLAGRVVSGGRRLDKPGVLLPADVPLELLAGRRFVGRGARKLAGALERFGLRVEGRDVLDVGASTGGFTQALLEAGARAVIALDVGRGQLDWSLRTDPRVRPLEGLNARYLRAELLPFLPSLAAVDVSFISLRKVLPAVAGCLAPGGEIVALVKPQFEAGRGRVGRGGIVRDATVHREVLESTAGWAVERGWGVCGACESPLRGADGNREFFLHLAPQAAGLSAAALARSLQRALEPDARSGA